MNLRRVLFVGALLVPLLLAEAADPVQKLRGPEKRARADLSETSQKGSSSFQRRKLSGSKGKKGKGGGNGPRRRPRPPKRILVTLAAVQPISIATDGTLQGLGTEFIYNSDIFADTTLSTTSVVGFVSGVCTRTQALQTSEAGTATVVGGGHCSFTYSIDDGTFAGTIESAGEMYDVFNNTLSVTGGTESFVEASGSILLTPVYAEGSTDVDVFTAAAYYLMDAGIYLPYRNIQQKGW